MPALRWLATFMAVASLGACDAAMIAGSPSGLDPALLTPDVARQLDARGFFPEQQPEAGYEQPRSRRDADSLARRYIREHAETQRVYWESARGTDIDVTRLRRCGPILLSRAAYDPAVTALDRPLRQELGGRYLLQFCDASGRPTLAASVPVEASRPVSEIVGDLAHIAVSGVSPEREAIDHLTAEYAATIAAARTGRRIAAIPELVRGRFRYASHYWRVQLDEPVIIRGLVSQHLDTVDVVLVGDFVPDVPAVRVLGALRAFDPARTGHERDTIPSGSLDPGDILVPRQGLPRWVEPFFRETPPASLQRLP